MLGGACLLGLLVAAACSPEEVNGVSTRTQSSMTGSNSPPPSPLSPSVSITSTDPLLGQRLVRATSCKWKVWERDWKLRGSSHPPSGWGSIQGGSLMSDGKVFSSLILAYCEVPLSILAPSPCLSLRGGGFPVQHRPMNRPGEGSRLPKVVCPDHSLQLRPDQSPGDHQMLPQWR